MISIWAKIKDGKLVIQDESQETREWFEKNKNYKGNLLCQVTKTTRERTVNQNRALHKWLKMKTDQCRDAGITTQMAFSKTLEIEMTPEIMKEIWRIVQNAMFKNGKSTRNLEKIGQIEEIVEHINRFFAEKFNLPGIEFPHDPSKNKQYVR